MNRCARCSGELSAFAVFCGHCGQVHEPDFDQLINLTIDGRYRICRRLGQGGLSTIFAATDLNDDSVVAIKISDPSQLARRDMSYVIDADHARGYWDEMLERMRREAETLTLINHPNIVRFYGTGLINDDLRYVAMEFLRGRTLRDEIDRCGSLEESRAVAVALEITSALSEVHSRGIVHRDIHPRNIMIADCGSQESSSPETSALQSAIRNPQSAIEESAIEESAIKLIDFGIAKFPQPPGAPPFTRRSTLAGAVAYASPEQCASQAVDHRSDIYSLGVALYEMATGERPFNGRTPTEIALKQIQSEPQPPRAINPAISASLERTILRALAKNPLDRQQNVEELSEELRTPSNRIVIPMAASADDQADLTLSADRFTDVDEAESKLKLVRRRRRRLVVAAAATIVAILASALLFGRPSFSLRHKSLDAAQNAGADASPSPAVIGSDADSLELAANMSAQNANGGMTNAATQAAPTSIQPTQPANPTAANNAVSNRSAAGAAAPPRPSPAPSPVPPRAQPQMPPAPSPDIAIARAPQSDSDPDLAQAPSKERDGAGWHRENETANSNSRRSPNDDARRDSDRDDDHESKRRRDDDAGAYRRLPDPPNRGDRDDDDDDYFDRIGPKLIQWSGRVNFEREIKIEMPGVPGTVEIPRAYRDRVGIVEPPSANNQWRCAVLRVFGRGGVSIVIRWWPAARNAARFTARR